MTPSTLSMPPDVVAVYAANVDADPSNELILERRSPAGDAPDRLTLTILHFSTSGSVTEKVDVPLGNKAQFWDAEHGLYVMDRDGIVRYDGATATRVVSRSTPLAGLGATTPAHADFLHDVDADQVPELLLYEPGKLSIWRADGTALGAVPASPEGTLESNDTNGGQSFQISLHTPAFAVGDVDGDGNADLAIPSHAKLQVWFGGGSFGGRSALLTLPLDLEPREEPPREGVVRRPITGVWLTDVDGDKKMDLAVQRLVVDGSFFGATSEMLFARGTGAGFGALATLSTSSAAFGVELIDFDGDGDRDWVVPEVDVGMANLARAMLSKAVRVDLRMYPFGGGSFASAPRSLRSLNFPLSPSGRFTASYKGDVDGDGRLDLVTNEGEDAARVFRGTGAGLESSAWVDQDLRVPLGSESLFVADLTGDKKAEILVWGASETTATLLHP